MHASVLAELLDNGRSLQGQLPRRHEDKYLSHTNDEISVRIGYKGLTIVHSTVSTAFIIGLAIAIKPLAFVPGDCSRRQSPLHSSILTNPIKKMQQNSSD